MIRRFACLVAFAVLAIPLLAQEKKQEAKQEKKAEVRVERDLVYGKGDNVDLKLDLAMPKDGDGPFPAVVCVHGGGWKGGNRSDFRQAAELLASRGYVAVTISYRLVPTAIWPAQIEDCKAAVRWLRANAKKYKIDPDRIGAMGASAGGHLVSQLGLADKDAGLEGKGGNPEQSSKLQAVVNIFGPSDFPARVWNEKLEKELIEPFLGGSLADKPDVYKKASPITYVRKEVPPFLFFHGTEDPLVPISQSRTMVEKLKAAGANAKLIEVKGAGHGWGGQQLQDSIEQMVAFFDEHLKKAK